MSKVSNKKKSNNTNSIQKLSDIVPELAYFDKVKKQVSFSSLLTKARVAARYSKEKNLSKDTKSKIKSLFSAEHFVAVTYMRDFLLGLPDLSRDERNHRQKKLTEFYDKVKDLLFESLDDNVSNLDKFNELEREEGIIWGGVAFDAGTYQGCGTIDKKTRVVKFPEPAKPRLKTNDKEHSQPLFMTQWAYIFGISKNTMRQLRKSDQYHFRQVSQRKWTLPKEELPAEYFEKYRNAIP